jgi:glycosyltransferase involved in cell wall biosynthesis
MVQRKAISAIIPFFEAHRTITQALRSLLTGLRPPDEIIIVNDGSSAESSSALKALLTSLDEPRVRLIDHAENLGGAEARNTAVRDSLNDWIFCLDADNMVSHRLLAELIDSVHIDDDTVGAIAPQRILFFKEDINSVTHAWNQGLGNIGIERVLKSAVWPGASGNYLFSRRSWLSVGGYPANAGSLDTWGFGLRQIAKGFEMKVVPGTYYFHRSTRNSYWRREDSITKQRSMRATGLVLEAAGLVPPQLIRDVLGRRKSETWFDRRKAEPPGSRNVKNLQWGFSESFDSLPVQERNRLLKELSVLQRPDDLSTDSA